MDESRKGQRRKMVVGDNPLVARYLHLLPEVKQEIFGERSTIYFIADHVDMRTWAAVRADETGEGVDRILENYIDRAWDRYEISIYEDTTIGELLRMVAETKE